MSMDIALGTDGTFGRMTANHPNPMFDYLTGFVPRKLKDLLKWSEYLAFNSAHIYATVRKFGEYPITELEYDTTSDAERDRHVELYEKTLRFKGFLTKVSFDKWIYGNVFVSVYEPFKRFLVCNTCRVKTDIKACDYSFNLDRLQFKFHCPACKRHGPGDVDDQKLVDKRKIVLIRWDPKAIDIDFNPITGESLYFYTIPRNLTQQVKAGNKNLINSMPMEFLRAMQRKKTFLFADGQLYHMKVPGPAGVEPQWGFPPITAAIKLFLFAAILRKANEAIALEHITPFRVMFPQAASGNGDPATTINLATWREQLEANLRKWRRDPLQIQFAPAPLGVQNVGGDGRALLTLGELQEAEKNICLSLGVPLEFLQGGLGQTRGEITLRMIENQLQTHIEDLNDLTQWVENKVSVFLGFETIKVKLADFKMIDDVEDKGIYLQLYQAGELSRATLFDRIGLDPAAEDKKIKQDALDKAKRDMDLQAAIGKLQNSLSARVRAQAQQAQSGAKYDVQAVVGQAQQIAQELAGVDEGTKRSRLDALQGQDPVMYAVVVQQLEQLNAAQEADAKAQTRMAPAGG